MKQRCHWIRMARLCSLKSKEPRLRDWNLSTRWAGHLDWDLKSKEPRLRDWNVEFDEDCIANGRASGLKSKEPRLRDWNPNGYYPGANKVIVHLEIKRTSITRLKPPNTVVVVIVDFWLEIKRTSITRLKLGIRGLIYPLHAIRLEIKRTSITRLKREVQAIGRMNRHLSLEIKRTSITRLKR